MYKCLACDNVWGTYVDPEGYYSHGFCSECLKQRFKNKFHKEQLNYSGNPCFGAPKEYDCEEELCRYREMCRDFTEFNAECLISA